MASKWRKAMQSLSCLYVPMTLEDSPPSERSTGRVSDAPSLSPVAARDSDFSMPATPTPSSSGLRLSRQNAKSPKGTCAICLMSIKPGQGHAIFTAECAHSFHFHCITSNVKHGNQICPVCRAKWKEIPFQSPINNSNQSTRSDIVNSLQDDAWMAVVRRIPHRRTDANRHISSVIHASEPSVFDDDQVIDQLSNETVAHDSSLPSLEVKTCPEVSAVSRSASFNNFTILVHLKALTGRGRNSRAKEANLSLTQHYSRAPVDLVTVLDVSGSMAGTKLALLKRAMGFVIQHLGPSDRLSVVVFSSNARRLFPLRRMTDAGRQEALQAVNGLTSNGGTNIAEGLKKGVKVMMDRKWKNPVVSLIVLSDGQDTYTISSAGGTRLQTDYQSLLPLGTLSNGGNGIHVPVHAFGFGADHDAAAMHSISEGSGGTFSFIETESVIQDAFAQCIGGLLSVVVQELKVVIECVDPKLQLGSIKAGSYRTQIMPGLREGCINVGDLYAEEERDFLITVDIPVDMSCSEMSLVKVNCVYRDPISKELVALEPDELKILRPEITGDLAVSIEVDRQRNRIRAAEAMTEAKTAAEGGDLNGAVLILERFSQVLSESISAQVQDPLCVCLAAELREMQERMGNRRMYESSGRAYVLSGMSSHSWQRATARGHSTNNTSLVQAYQTPSMTEMITRSQTMFFGSPSLPAPYRRGQSFNSPVQPR